MRPKGFEGMACSMASVMGALGDRWGALIMRDLYLGLTRYDDLHRSTGATHAMLSAEPVSGAANGDVIGLPRHPFARLPALLLGSALEVPGLARQVQQPLGGGAFVVQNAHAAVCVRPAGPAP
jgi:hypothetical protein